MRTLAPLLSLVLWSTGASADVQHNRWCQTTTPDFELVSDLRQGDARWLADKMMRFKLAVEALRQERPLRGPPLEVIVFRRTRDYRRVLATRSSGGRAMVLDERAMIALDYEAWSFHKDPLFARRAAFHEYAHYLLRAGRKMRYPRWYDEGYAQLLSTIYFAKEGVVVGYVSPNNRSAMSRLQPSLSELLKVRDPIHSSHHKTEGIYAKAWLFVHMLHFGHLTGLPPLHALVPHMLVMIDAGEPDELAIERGLGVDLATLQHRLREYGERKSLPTLTLDIDVSPQTTTDYRCLEPVEIRHILAYAADMSRNHDYAAKLYEEVLAENPDDVDALVSLSYSSDDTERALELARRALGIDPDHPEAIDRVAELEANER